MKPADKKLKNYNVTILKLFETILSLNEDQQTELLRQANDMAYGESRKSLRKQCAIPVNYLANDHLHTDLIKNISRTGIYIETGKNLPVGTSIVMSFTLPEFDKPLKVEGKIVWCDMLGFGAIFTSLTIYQQEMLGVIVERMDKLAR